ncbi:MAG TPA: energy transducer TonB [Terriglobales bacterium]|nr:energy transducer TonB [Terriglobales bacterium]
MRVATPYGAFELKSSYQKNFSIAVLISCLIYLVLFGSFVLFTRLAAQKPVAKRVITIRTPLELGAPPSLTQNVAHQVAVAAPAAAAAPSVGVPKAVPDEQVKETVTLASQAELGVLQNPTVATEGTGKESLAIQIPQDEYLPAPGEFVPYEEAPVPIKWVKPTYPELARKSGVEGKVFVEALVDRSGKVREARCVKEGSVNLDIFCDEAIKAAMQNEYKPAIANHQPIAVRVLYKIDFNLK